MANKTDGVDEKGVVIVADPNVILAQDKNVVNGTLPYEDMRPFVALKCMRRRDNGVRIDQFGRYHVEGDAVGETIHFLGFDDQTKQFTTNYTEGIMGGNGLMYEGFGIRDINVRFEANMMPVVDITFMDVKGSTVAAKGEHSPFATLFDFPPPIFQLLIKGAFGKISEYDLHMTERNVSLDGSGNYILKGKFIGEFFGPLTDILTGWLRAVPYLKDEAHLMYQSENDLEVNSYFELIYRGSLLYSKIDEFKKNNGDLQESNNVSFSIGEIQNIANAISGFFDADKITDQGNVTNVNLAGLKCEFVGNFEEASNANPYQAIIKLPLSQLSASSSFLASIAGGNEEDAPKINYLREYINNELVGRLEKDYGQLNPDGKKPIVVKYKSNITITEAVDPIQSLMNPTSGISVEKTYVFTVDLTKIAIELKKNKDTFEGSNKEYLTSVQNNLADLVHNILGIRPTIGEIFRVIMTDFDWFMNAIKEAGETPKSPIATSSGGAKLVAQSPWPYVVKTKPLGKNTTQVQDVFIYPAQEKEFADWAECKFVEKYCQSLVEQQKAIDKIEQLINQIDSDFYNPISPYEAFLGGGSALSTNEYVKKDSATQFVKTLVTRFLFARDYTYKSIFNTFESNTLNIGLFDGYDFIKGENKTKLIKSLAKLEANNAFYGITSEKFIKEVKTWKTNDLIDYLKKNCTSTVNNGELNNDEDLRYLLTGYQAGFDQAGIEYGLRSVKFRGNERAYTKHSGTTEDFAGIIEITTKNTGPYAKLTTLRNEADSGESDVNKERIEILADHASTVAQFLFAHKDAEKPELTQGNTLLFPDRKATEDGKSDFFAPSNLDLDKDTKDLYSWFLLAGMMELSGGKVRFITGSTPTVLRNNILEKLADSKCLISPYNSSFLTAFKAYDKTVFEKFAQAGTVEMPSLVFYVLAYSLINDDDFFVGTKGRTTHRILAAKDYDKFKAALDASDDIFQQFYDSAKELVTTPNTAFSKLFTLTSGGTYQSKTNAGSVHLFVSGNEDVAETMVKEFRNFSKNIVRPMYIINSTDQTFLLKDTLRNLSRNFRSALKSDGTVNTWTIGSGSDKEVDNSFTLYMDEFFNVLSGLLTKDETENRKRIQEIENKFRDNDFKSNIYYNFKSIYDRWLVGKPKWSTGDIGTGVQSTYDKFSFVTRSQQNISDVAIVDFQNLIDDAKDGQLSVFSSISKLLQTNNFMYFPLNSYIDVNRDGKSGSKVQAWYDSWWINNDLTDRNLARPKFVCMYIGGYSSFANVESPVYSDDAVNFGLSLPKDFTYAGYDDQFVYSFKVNVGSQNQTVFSDFSLSTEEFKVTDDSLRMQSDLIDKQSETNPIRKSQNLINLYSQQSYSAGITIPFGNTCIHPTQYFELDGVAIWKGAYMIYSVEHNISADSQRLVTKFKGYRISSYVFPIIDEYVLSYLGIDNTISNTVQQNQEAITTNMKAGGAKNGVNRAVADPALANDDDPELIKNYQKAQDVYKTQRLIFEEIIPANVREAFTFKVKAIAWEAGVDPNWLMLIMYRESRFTPDIESASSTATGLIQIIASSAADITPMYNKLYRRGKQKIGKVTTGMIKYLDHVTQLNVVRAYLLRVKQVVPSLKNAKKLDSYWQLNLAVFRPRSVPNWANDNAVLLPAGSGEYRANKVFDTTGKGYVTVGDYKEHLRDAFSKSKIPNEVITRYMS